MMWKYGVWADNGLIRREGWVGAGAGEAEYRSSSSRSGDWRLCAAFVAPSAPLWLSGHICIQSSPPRTKHDSKQQDTFKQNGFKLLISMYQNKVLSKHNCSAGWPRSRDWEILFLSPAWHVSSCPVAGSGWSALLCVSIAANTIEH